MMFSDKAKLARKWLFTERKITEWENDTMYCFFSMDEMKAMCVVRQIISENNT